MDLSTKTSLPPTACFVAAASDERKHAADHSLQPYECISAGDHLQGKTLLWSLVFCSNSICSICCGFLVQHVKQMEFVHLPEQRYARLLMQN